MEATDQTSLNFSDGIYPETNYVGGNVGKSQPISDLDLITNIVAKHGEHAKTDLSVFQMFLQSALAEVEEYNVLIKDAKTQAKRDFYQKKIKKVTKRLQRLLPA